MAASTWARQDESNYLLEDGHPDPFSPPNGLESLDTQLLSSDEEEDDEALSLPSAGVANIRGETPDSEEDNQEVDIGEFDWGDADKEVNDFLAESGEESAYTSDESDNERHDLRPIQPNGSVASNISRTRKGVKRKREGDTSREPSEAEDSDNEPNDPRSRLAKRIQTANSRKSQLSKTIVLSSKGSSAADSPNGSSHGHTPAEGHASANGSAFDRDSADDEEDSDLDDWADEFEKELS